MEQYFDAHLYLANWGTHRLMLRLPLALLPLAAVEPYTTEDGLRAWATKTHVVIDFRSDSEDDYEWTEGEGRIDPLLPVRDELRAGDLRALYVGWLATLTGSEEIDEDALEPPVPPGLRRLTEAQLDLATYLRVDDDLFEVAAERSAADAPTGPDSAELAAWVTKLPERTKNDALIQLLAGEGTAAATDLMGRFRADTARANPRGRDAASSRRTVGELLAARDELAEKNRRAAAEKKAKDDARRARSGRSPRATPGFARRQRSRRVARGRSRSGHEVAQAVRPRDSTAHRPPRPREPVGRHDGLRPARRRVA